MSRRRSRVEKRGPDRGGHPRALPRPERDHRRDGRGQDPPRHRAPDCSSAAAPAPRPSARAREEPPSKARSSSRTTRVARSSEETLGDLAEEVDATRRLVLRRTLTEEGRSRCYVGGVSVPVRALAVSRRTPGLLPQPAGAGPTHGAGRTARHPRRLPLRGRAAREARALGSCGARSRGTGGSSRRSRASSEARLREVDFLRFQVSELEEAGYSAMNSTTSPASGTVCAT